MSNDTQKNEEKKVVETAESQGQIQKTDNFVSENLSKSESNNNNNTIESSKDSEVNHKNDVALNPILPPKRLSIYLENRSKLEDSSLKANSRAVRLYTLSG